MTNPQDMVFFDDINLDRAVGLVFELAAQLHIERQRRLAMENLLVAKNIVGAEELEALAGDQDFLATARGELDQSLRKLMRIVTETGDETGPLRAEALEGE